MSDLSHSKFRLAGLSLLAVTVTLAACSPKVATEASPTLAALDSSESALLPPLPDVQPMLAGPAAPLRLAPAATALPRGRTLRYASASGNDRYALIDRANRINDTIGDAPPDYGFDYQDGVEPYGWESAGGGRTYAEPIDGGYRTYYYDPGASEPYLVRDPSYSYGYSNGQLVTVYDRGGRVLDGWQGQQQADYAARYYDRGRTMYAAAGSHQRRGVAATRWAGQREVISTQRAEWNRTQASTPEWRSYRSDHAVEDQRLIEERTARAQAARQFSTWQAQSFRGPTPALYDQQQPERRDGVGYGQRQPAQRQPDQRQVDQRQVDQRQAQFVEQQRQQQAVQQQQARLRATTAQRQVAAQRQAVAAQIRQQRAAKTNAEQQRILREKQAAEQQRTAIRHQRQKDTAKRVGEARQNATNAAQAQKAAQDRAAQNKAAQDRAARHLAAMKRAAQHRAAQDRAAQDKPAREKVRVWPRPGADPG